MAFIYKTMPSYVESRTFVRWCVDYLRPRLQKSEAPNLADQLARASTSVCLNIAEGSGRWHKKDKCHFYQIAHGSAVECSAILDLEDVVRAVADGDEEVGEAQELLNKVCAGLVILIGAVKEREVS